MNAHVSFVSYIEKKWKKKKDTYIILKKKKSVNIYLFCIHIMYCIHCSSYLYERK
jgi:fumarate reductase subunit C